ncbi:MAG: DNA helicase RecQ [Bacteroidota bacterium]|nr:DNA helicase RecQ [Bacteroidota bacterium]
MDFSTELLHNNLKKNFGFDSFKGAQEKIITTLLQEEDVMVIMPTGGGKSMCYQLPALIGDGVAIIVSPLIALMKNQVDTIRGFNKNNSIAHVLNSSLTKTETLQVKNDLLEGKTKMLYVAPESLIKQTNIELLKTLRINFYAIDEAHCISEWGHDFRPEYRKLRQIIENIKRRPIIALTATATPKVRQDIIKNLRINSAQLFIDSFNRSNLFYEIKPKLDVAKQIIQFIHLHKGESGIVYCLSRKKVEEIAEILQINGIKALPYHAGLEPKTRIINQDAFLMEECDVIVATIAFGMGIDKPDIRFVIHHDIPKSLEGYYQETGRAGRDGGKGNCITFYDYKDIEKLEKFLQGKPVAEQEVGRLLIMETIAFSESSMCRRKYLLHYFGESFKEEDCQNMCDNCSNPKPTIEGKKYVSLLLNTIYKCNEKFKPKEIAKIMIGESNSLINQYMNQIQDVFGKGEEKGVGFWHAVIRQIYVKKLITKEIETYGILKLTDDGKRYLKTPYSFKLSEDHDYNDLSAAQETISRAKGEAVDKTLFNILKNLRKKEAKTQNLPPTILFTEPSLIDMANQYPITLEEMALIQGVGQGKAEKYGKNFIKVIAEYVEKNQIERLEDIAVRSVAKKSSNKVYIIQSLDKNLSLEDIARSKKLTLDELILELEAIVESGTKINLEHIINDIVDDDEIVELYEIFRETNTASFEEIRSEFSDDEFSDDEIKLLRIHFISKIGN